MITNELVQSNTELNLSEIENNVVCLKSKPRYLNIDLTGRCNINPPCLFCSLKGDGYSYQFMDTSYLEKYKEFIDRSEKIIDCSFGEPFTHPGFLPLVENIARNSQRFAFSTNGLLMTPSKADILIQYGSYIDFLVSVNAVSADIYYKLTGQDYEKLINNIRYFTEQYQEKFRESIPPMALSFIVMKINQHEIIDFIHMAKALDVWGVHFAHLFDIQENYGVRNDFGYRFQYQDEMLSFDEYRKIGLIAKEETKKYGLNIVISWEPAKSEIETMAEPNISIPCLFPWKYLFVQEHTNNVYICCYSNNAIGNLSESSLNDIWNSVLAVEIRKSLTAKEIPDFCLTHGKNCPLVSSQS